MPEVGITGAAKNKGGVKQTRAGTGLLAGDMAVMAPFYRLALFMYNRRAFVGTIHAARRHQSDI